MRENILDCFRGTVWKSAVGAVMMISGGAVAVGLAEIAADARDEVRSDPNIPRGIGGADSSAWAMACFLALADS